MNPVHVLDLGLYLPALFLTGVAFWRDDAIGYAFGVPFLVFSVMTGTGILLIDYLTVASGTAVSAGPEIFVGALVAAGLMVYSVCARDGLVCRQGIDSWKT